MFIQQGGWWNHSSLTFRQASVYGTMPCMRAASRRTVSRVMANPWILGSHSSILLSTNWCERIAYRNGICARPGETGREKKNTWIHAPHSANESLLYLYMKCQQQQAWPFGPEGWEGSKMSLLYMYFVYVYLIPIIYIFSCIIRDFKCMSVSQAQIGNML